MRESEVEKQTVENIVQDESNIQCLTSKSASQCFLPSLPSACNNVRPNQQYVQRDVENEHDDICGECDAR